MYWKHFAAEIPSRAGWIVWRWRRNLRFFWYRIDREAWLFLTFVALVFTGLGFAMSTLFSHHDEKRNQAREYHAQHVACLARNIYFEARGEPLAGQYAVAEVTMNRKASGRFPRTVCEVVYEQRWDSIRKRYVGAFSWTEFKILPVPGGVEWERAQQIAEEVYYQKHTPKLRGAMFFHANYITPEWAKEKRQIAKIGRHIFYR